MCAQYIFNFSNDQLYVLNGMLLDHFEFGFPCLVSFFKSHMDIAIQFWLVCIINLYEHVHRYLLAMHMKFVFYLSYM